MIFPQNCFLNNNDFPQTWLLPELVTMGCGQDQFPIEMMPLAQALPFV